MRLVIQRIAKASVTVGDEIVGRTGPGLCLFLAVAGGDSEASADRLADKVLQLRIFDDERGKMNRSVLQTGGEILLVSEFTLYGDCRKGARPSFSRAAASPEALRLYDYFAGRLRGRGVKVATGRFQAEMEVSLSNDGPVTFILEN